MGGFPVFQSFCRSSASLGLQSVANASTAGFRAEEVKFESVLSRASLDPTAYATTGKPFLSRKSGEFVRTDNLFDVAVQGDAWLAVQTPNGPAVRVRFASQ